MYRVAIAIVLLAGAAAAQDRKAVEVDFEAAALGTVPKGWTVAKTGTVEGSEWKVVEDKTAPKGAKVLAQVAESPNAVFNLCVARQHQPQGCGSSKGKWIRAAGSHSTRHEGRTDGAGGRMARPHHSDAGQ